LLHTTQELTRLLPLSFPGLAGTAAQPDLAAYDAAAKASAAATFPGVATTAAGTLAAKAAGSDLWDSIKSGAGSIADAVGGGANLGALAGGLLGAAASGDTTTSSSKDPWAPAQQYLKDNLATNARMQQYYQANPFSQEQKQAYQGLLDTNANGLSNAGNYAQIANNFMGSNRGLLAQMPTLNTGVKAAPVNWAAYSNIGKA
jgi:hypothetical protein